MQRKIINRTKGENHGLITRMINPSKLGRLLKPFVFLDYIQGKPKPGAGFGWHPHSGIATFTYHLEGGSNIEESTGNQVSFGPRDVEYLQAGLGAWHKGDLLTGQKTTGFQLWISLPPELEQEGAKSIFLKKEELQRNDTITVLMGEYEGLRSKITPPNDMNYLEVNLSPGQSWTYTPPKTHNILWLIVFDGKIDGELQVNKGELIAFEEGQDAVEIFSENGAGFILGSAHKFAYDLVLGRSSIHTSSEALEKSQLKIKEIYQDLKHRNIIK